MVEKGNVLDEFDDDVFESVIYKVIIGGVDSEEKYDPFLITYVFNLVGSEVTNNDGYMTVGSFELEHRHYVFTYDEVAQTKVKTLKHSMSCRIALKTE